MATTDETVESIAVQCPGGRTFTISKTAGQNGTEWTLYESEGLTAIWEFCGEYPAASNLDQFGDGTYRVTVHYAVDSEYIDVEFQNFQSVTDIPIFTSPENNASFSSGTPITFTWDTNYIDDNANAIAIFLEQEGGNDEDEIEWIGFEPFPASQTITPSDGLSDGLWTVEFVFGNIAEGMSSGVEYTVGKTSISEYIVKLGPLHTVSGQVAYNGRERGDVRVGFHLLDPGNPTNTYRVCEIVATGSSSPWTYSYDLPSNDSYYVNAYLDVNGNHRWDNEDPSAWYQEGNEWRSSILLNSDKPAIDIFLPGEVPMPLPAINMLLLSEN
jgi:hypothetical protein